MELNHIEALLNHVDREEEIRKNQRGDFCEKLNISSIFGLESLRCNFQIFS